MRIRYQNDWPRLVMFGSFLGLLACLYAQISPDPRNALKAQAFGATLAMFFFAEMCSTQERSDHADALEDRIPPTP